MVTYPSSTFQLTYDSVLTTAAAGDGNAFYCLPIIGDNSTIYPIHTANNASAGANYSYSSFNWTSRATIVAAYSQVRPVSAVIYAAYIGATLADAGQICGGLVSPSVAPPANFSAGQNLVGSKTNSIRNGIRVTWKPQDNSDLEYVPPTSNAVNPAGYPYVWIGTTGTTVGTTGFRIRAVVNYEGIPTNDTLSIIATTPSTSDLKSLEAGKNWCANLYDAVEPLFAIATPFAAAAGTLGSAGLAARRFVPSGRRRTAFWQNVPYNGNGFEAQENGRLLEMEGEHVSE
jgi:hypothetical protein